MKKEIYEILKAFALGLAICVLGILLVYGLVRLGEKAEENRAKPQCQCVCCVEVEE